MNAKPGWIECDLLLGGNLFLTELPTSDRLCGTSSVPREAMGCFPAEQLLEHGHCTGANG